MYEAIKKYIGFPYPEEYEEGFRKYMLQTLYKPALVIVMVFMIVILVFISAYSLYPGLLGEPETTRSLIFLHAAYCLFTAICLILAVWFRRALFERPEIFVFAGDLYAILACCWANITSALLYGGPMAHVLILYTSICVAMLAHFKPWQGLIVFTLNSALHLILVRATAEVKPDFTVYIVNMIFLAFLCSIITTTVYRNRANTYYTSTLIMRQNEVISGVNEQLQKRVYIDELTELFNRRYFDEELPKVMDKYLKEGSIVCGMMIDVDYFKAYNDRYGHPNGDICLRRIATVLKRAGGNESAHPVRYGGEEFFLFSKVESEAGAAQLAENIRAQVEAEYMEHLSSPKGKVTISIGLVICKPGQFYTLRAMTKRADMALYASKENGRNTVFVHKGQANDGEQLRLEYDIF